MATATDSLLSDFLRLAAEEKAASAALKKVRDELEQVESLLSEQWGAAGVQSMNIAGQLVYRSRELHVSVLAADRADVVAACESLGLVELIETSVPTSRLKAWLRESMGEQDDAEVGDNGFASVEERIPAELRGKVKVYESYGLRIRKG